MASRNPIEKMQAAKSLGNTLGEICTILEISYMEQLIESESDEATLRDHIYHRLRILKDMQVVLNKIVASGQIAEAEVIRRAKIQTGELKEFY